MTAVEVFTHLFVSIPIGVAIGALTVGMNLKAIQETNIIPHAAVTSVIGMCISLIGLMLGWIILMDLGAVLVFATIPPIAYWDWHRQSKSVDIVLPEQPLDVSKEIDEIIKKNRANRG